MKAILAAVILCAFTSAPAMAAKKVTVGCKKFTEQYILAEMAKQLLKNAGFKVETKMGLGSVVMWKSLLNGEIDLTYEYTGTSYTVYNKQKDPEIMTNKDKCYEWVKKADAKKGLVWLEPLDFNNTYTLLMRKKDAKSKGIKTISDLANYIKQNPGEISFAIDAEFYQRPDGFKKLMKIYNFHIRRNNIKLMSIGITYMALKEKEVSSAMGFSTDGRISYFGFVNLVDDKKFFPVYNPAPVVRKEVLAKYPEIRDILKPLTKKLTLTEIQKLNTLVDIKHKDIKEVVTDWLKANELI